MKEITLTINGKQVKGKEGDTVLDVCQANDIYVPTLCHLEGLSNVGACRLCVVEIGGERRINPACTYPARDGLTVQTHTEKLENYRRMALELLFTERNHLCPFCAASGECELQDLAYRYQMDHARYSYSWPSLPVDSVNDYIVIDHNRCVLCGRCVRVCDEVVANHTLDFANRGWKTVVCADLNESLGESSCISCGACAQACPTGAIFTKPSVYKGRAKECNITRTVCSLCGVGCEIDVLVKDNNLVRIDGVNLTDKTGQLCFRGRFEQLYEKRARILTPWQRNARGRLRECSWDEALNRITEKLVEVKKKYGADSIAGIASTQNSNESLRAFKEFINETVGSSKLDTTDGDDYRTLMSGIAGFSKDTGLDIESPLEQILQADCVLVVGADPLTTHPVAGCYVLRTIKRNKACLVVVDPSRNAFSYRTFLWLRPQRGTEAMVIEALVNLVHKNRFGNTKKASNKIAKSLMRVAIDSVCEKSRVNANDLEKVAQSFSSAKCGVILCGEGILRQKNPKMITNLFNLAALTGGLQDGKARVICLKPCGNSRGGWDLGLPARNESVVGEIGEDRVKALYLLLGDDTVEDKGLLRQLKKVEFLVVQSAYRSALTDIADIVLPSVTWAEREGTYMTLDGVPKRVHRVLQPAEVIKEDGEIFREISKRLLRGLPRKKRG